MYKGVKIHRKVRIFTPGQRGVFILLGRGGGMFSYIGKVQNLRDGGGILRESL